MFMRTLVLTGVVSQEGDLFRSLNFGQFHPLGRALSGSVGKDHVACVDEALCTHDPNAWIIRTRSLTCAAQKNTTSRRGHIKLKVSQLMTGLM